MLETRERRMGPSPGRQETRNAGRHGRSEISMNGCGGGPKSRLGIQTLNKYQVMAINPRGVKMTTQRIKARLKERWREA